MVFGQPFHRYLFVSIIRRFAYLAARCRRRDRNDFRSRKKGSSLRGARYTNNTCVRGEEKGTEELTVRARLSAGRY